MKPADKLMFYQDPTYQGPEPLTQVCREARKALEAAEKALEREEAIQKAGSRLGMPKTHRKLADRDRQKALALIRGEASDG